MSSVNIIVAIALLMGLLVCYAFFTQSIQRRNEHKKRLLAALKSRSRTFKYMLSGFPKGFLSKDLTLLVQQSLAEVSEQLGKLEPENPAHRQDFQLASAALAESRKQKGPHQPVKLESTQQIKEVKACLEELNKFVVNLVEKNTVSQTLASSYRSQIAQYLMQITVDSHDIQASKAAAANKVKLAIHHYEIALNTLKKNGKGLYQQRMELISKELDSLREILENADPHANSSRDNEAAESNAQEWDKMTSGDDLWKKKNVYD